MANKISRAMDALDTCLKTLVNADGTGLLKAVKREIIHPTTEPNPPVAALVVDEMYREGSVWIVQLIVQLLVHKGGGDTDKTIIRLVSNVDTAITALIDSGQAQASIDRPSFIMWYPPSMTGAPRSKAGAEAKFRMRVTDPILLD